MKKKFDKLKTEKRRKRGRIMKYESKGNMKVALIVVICILIVVILAIFGVIAFQIFYEEEKEPQYISPTNTMMQNQTNQDELMVLEKMAKPFIYCTDPECKINEEDHLHFGDKLAYNPTKLKDGIAEDTLSYTTFPINTGEGSVSCVFDARTTDQINEWYVIGKENDKLILLAGNTTATLLELKGARGVINSVYEMNKICAIYGNGIGAESAACLTLERLNDLAGVTANLTNNTVTYKDGSNVEYLFNYGTEIDYGKNTSSTRNQNKIQHIDPWTKEGQVIPTYITQYITSKSPLKVKSGYYGYSIANSKVTATNERLEKVNLALNKDMWLASIGMNADEKTVRYGPAGIAANNTVVSAIDLFSSDGNESIGKFPVRPVITLESNVNTGILEKVM